MKEKIRHKLTHNLGLKILSVVLAVFTWLIMVNVSNPMMTVTQTVPVEFINEEVLTNAGLTYESLSRNSVTVSYKIHVRDESRVSASDFSVYADLAQLYDVTGSIPLQADMSTYMARSLVQSGSLTVSPSVVRIQTEPIQTKTFVLQARTSGEEAEGYDIGEVHLTPTRISATGAESVIGQISFAGVEINVDGIDTDVSGQAAVFLYDANGNRLDLSDEVELNVTQAAYEVSVLRVKDLTLDYQIIGTVANGYRFTGVDSDVKIISVVGLRSVLAGLNTLAIPDPALNLDGATQDVVVEVNLNDYLPDNISIVGDQPATAVVTMHVERLETRTFEFDTSNVELTGQKEGYEYSLDQQTITLQISGLAEDLDVLEVENIHVAADVSEMEPGVYPLALQVELGEGFDFRSASMITVWIRDLTAPSVDAGGPLDQPKEREASSEQQIGDEP